MLGLGVRARVPNAKKYLCFLIADKNSRFENFENFCMKSAGI